MFLTQFIILLLLCNDMNSEFISHDVESYTSFIIDICEYYKTSSVIFLQNKLKEDVELTSIMHTWTRSFSRRGMITLTIYISDLHKISYYFRRIVRPQLVVILVDDKSIEDFSKVTKKFNMSFSTWLVMFWPGNYSHDYCHEPSGNLFNLHFNTEMLVMCSEDKIIREWYSFGDNRTETYDLLTWEFRQKFHLLTKLNLYNRRNNMKGHSMRGVLVKNSKFVYESKITKKISGFFANILSEFCMDLNFTLQPSSVMNEFGFWDSTVNTWRGAIGELVANRAEIGLSDFSMTSSRRDVIDFTLPLLVAKHCLYIKKPKIFGVQWATYFQAFHYKIWIVITIIVLVIPLLLTYVKAIRNEYNIAPQISDSYIQVWGILCQQGLIEHSRRFSLRIMYFSIFLLALILYTAYSAALICYLTVAVRTLPFMSLEEFAQDGTYKLILIRGTSHHDLFINSNDATLKKVAGLLMETNSLPGSSTEAFKQVCDGSKIALYTSEEVRVTVDPYIQCEIAKIDTGRIDNVALALNKNNPFTDLINYHLQKFLDNGMISRMKNLFSRRKLPLPVKYHPVIFESVFPAMLFIKIGIIASICILIAEKLYFAYKNNTNSTTN